MHNVFRKLRRDKSGNFGIIAALTMVPLIGSIGLALDFSRGLNARTEIQDGADEAALIAARKGLVNFDQTMHAALVERIKKKTLLSNVQVQSSWTAVNEFTVTVKGDLPLTFASIIPTVGTSTPVSATATARYREAQTT